MKSILKIIFSCLLLCSFSSYANFSDEPRLVKVSAKHAKLRAKLRVTEDSQIETAAPNAFSDDDNQNTSGQQINLNGSDGCNLNVGNVLIDDTVRNPPDEVIVIIEGDIIQSNSCR